MLDTCIFLTLKDDIEAITGLDYYGTFPDQEG
jgi:hypothetical protein